jgi:hypothetical protein
MFLFFNKHIAVVLPKAMSINTKTNNSNQVLNKSVAFVQAQVSFSSLYRYKKAINCLHTLFLNKHHHNS